MNTQVAVSVHENNNKSYKREESYHTLEDILNITRLTAEAENLTYAGSVKPRVAWSLFSAGKAVLVDVRSAEELSFVGNVPGSIHVPWATGTALTRNPRFVKELEKKVGKDKVILLLCRSGKRSALAAEAATKAGFTQVFNILEGFEGDIDENNQRGFLGGWRYYHLPWAQD